MDAKFVTEEQQQCKTIILRRISPLQKYVIEQNFSLSSGTLNDEERTMKEKETAALSADIRRKLALRRKYVARLTSQSASTAIGEKGLSMKSPAAQTFLDSLCRSHYRTTENDRLATSLRKISSWPSDVATLNDEGKLTLILTSRDLTRCIAVLHRSLRIALSVDRNFNDGCSGGVTAVEAMKEVCLPEKGMLLERSLRDYDALADYVPHVLKRLNDCSDGFSFCEAEDNSAGDDSHHIFPSFTTRNLCDLMNFKELQTMGFENESATCASLVADNSLLRMQIDLLSLLKTGLSRIHFENSNDNRMFASCIKIMSSILNYNAFNEPVIVAK